MLDTVTDQGQSDRAALARAVNELEAAKARVERDAKQVQADARKKLVVELLPVIDNVDRAAAAADAKSADGIRLVKRQLEAVLRGYGVERIEAPVGKRFDPQRHDAIATLPVTEPEQHKVVLDQVEPGYRFGDALLRPAKVVVGAYAKQPPATEAEPEPIAEPEPLAFEPEPSAPPEPGYTRLDPRFFRQPPRVTRAAPVPFRIRRW